MKLDSRNVKTLVRPAGKTDHVFWDDTMPGFGVRCRGDNRSFLVQYRVGVQQRRENLGDTRKVDLADARKAAKRRFGMVQLGQDPAAERVAAKAKAAAKRLTLGVTAERYLEAKKARLRPTSYADAPTLFHPSLGSAAGSADCRDPARRGGGGAARHYQAAWFDFGRPRPRQSIGAVWLGDEGGAV